MRLITRKLYRAFPELDRFSDAQCERFIKVARASRWFRVGAGVATTLMVLVLLVGALFAIATIGSMTDRAPAQESFDPFSGLWGVITIGAVLAPALVVPLLGRDVLLRLRVRYILRFRSACAQCGYRLLGLQVQDGTKVTCPECGRINTVDPSLGELTVDEAGFTRAAPDAGDNSGGIIYSSRFWLWFRRVTIGGLVLFVVLPVVVGGSYELWLRAQARRAAASAVTNEQIAAAIDALQPKVGNGRNATDELLQVLDRLHRRMTSRDRGEDVILGDGQAKFVAPSFWALASTDTPRNEDERRIGAAQRRLTEALLADLTKDGFFAGVDAIVTASDARWTCPPISNYGRMSAVPLPEFGTLQQLDAALRVRAAFAMRADDAEEYVAAFESRLMLARVCRSRGFVLDQMFEAAWAESALTEVVQALRSKPSWVTLAVLDRLTLAVERQMRPMDAGDRLTVLRLSALDEVARIFLNYPAVRFGGLSQEMRFYLNPNNTPGAKFPLWLGTYEANVEGVNGWFDAAVTQARLEPWQRAADPPVPPHADLPLVQTLTTNFYGLRGAIAPRQGESSADRVELRRRFAVVAIALERHRQAYGGYPSALQELGPLLPERPLDPWSGKELGYAVQGASYVLYSVGPDGMDNGGLAKPASDGQAVTGLDLVAGEK